MLPNVFLTAGQDMLTDIFQGASDVLSKIVTFITDGFGSVIGLIWGSSGLTNYGKLCIIPLGFGFFWLVFKWIMRLISFK